MEGSTACPANRDPHGGDGPCRWNRSVPTGYKVIAIPFRAGRPAGPPADFLAGFLRGREAWGRPVDVLVAPDGALLVTDDRAGAIYRITWEGSPGAP
ncbi:hypothetical protein [Caldinitratiruptor microaerophilus]|uniref:Uncharacterized protein n=1 Tax=Caldinitratiruptor microaerophilus TaxID=671077 RepID=A0AA35G910_9FIRM|nr:hypothetical protein [Caldinitratiruptor microaerophilus]BDG61625.1 hypothetical protein caldi_27150 [Caldinitratiruptor microaerophilus]